MTDAIEWGAGTGPVPDQLPGTALPTVAAVIPPLAPGAEFGKGSEPPKEAAEFAAKQAARAVPSLVEPAHQEWVRTWLQGLTTPKEDTAAVIDAIVERTLRQPTHEAIVQAQALLNELGRDPQITPLIRERITRDIVDRISGREAGA